MDPLEFWERCLDIIDRNKIKLFPKYSIPFNLLLDLLETRPCFLVDGDKQFFIEDLTKSKISDHSLTLTELKL